MLTLHAQPRYKIADLSRATGLPRQAVATYNQWGLIRATGHNACGIQLFGQEAIDSLRRIITCRASFKIQDIRRSLAAGRDDGPNAA